jgi:WhiB family redox-sensing transcriptional regulator
MRVSVSLSDRIPEQAPWEDAAACRQVDPELFWPQDSDRYTPAVAKGVCSRCRVRAECLATALEQHHTEGIWGGMTPRQRMLLARTE